MWEVCEINIPMGTRETCPGSEIPLAVVKEFYMGDDSDEGEDQELYHMAMVARTRPDDKKISCIKDSETKKNDKATKSKSSGEQRKDQDPPLNPRQGRSPVPGAPRGHPSS